MKRSFCRSCNAEIIWLEHFATGKRAPIDAEPSESGGVIPSFEDGQYRIATGADPKHERHANHFQTCTDAARFRKSRP